MNNSGHVRLWEDRVEISRDGKFGSLTQYGHLGDKTIFIRDITAVEFKAAGLVVGGHIRFSFVGGQEVAGKLITATNDENKVFFSRGQQPEFERLRDEIMSRMARARAPQAAATGSVADELAKLAALRDQGLLTPSEFADQKKRLLERA
jgi:hypothetical protein